MAGMTTRELLEKLYNQDYEKLKGKKLRMTRVRVPGKEVCLAHVINPSQSCIYQNLGLHIGVHEGEDHAHGGGGAVGVEKGDEIGVRQIIDARDEHADNGGNRK